MLLYSMVWVQSSQGLFNNLERTFS